MPFPAIDEARSGRLADGWSAGEVHLLDNVDKSLGQLRIPPSVLRELREVDEFKPHDFELDGVDAVNEDGTHMQTPECVRPNFEWRKYGAPCIGLQWRQVPVDDSYEFNNRKLDNETLAKQKRMTERAYHAYLQGGGGYMGDRSLEQAFKVSDREKDRRIKAVQKKKQEAVQGELRERMDAAKVLQARVRSTLLRPMYPWLYVARLALYREPVMNSKKNIKPSESSLGMSDVPDLPWCSCWTSLEPTYELDPKSTHHMRQIVADFEVENFESCLRRVDNLVSSRGRRKGRNAQDHVLIELAALCNRFGVRLFFLQRIEHSHAFFERVMRFTNNSSSSHFEGKAELFSWTCDLVGYCLWNQKKYEQSHWTITRAAPSNAPFNCNLVLMELIQARHQHTVSLLHGQVPSNFSQILKIVEHLDERGHQTATPSYTNLLCHQAQTIVFALARKGRRNDAATINRIIQRQNMSIEGQRKGISNDLRNCTHEFEMFIDTLTAQPTMDVLNDSSLSAGAATKPVTAGADDAGDNVDSDHVATTTILDGVALAEDTMRATNARFATSGADAIDHQAVVEAMPKISLVASGVVSFEPPDEPQWAKEFFSDVYWQRHSNLRRSKASYNKSLTSLTQRPNFR